MRLESAKRAFSMIELLAALTIVGIVAVVVIERTGSVRTAGGAAACHASKGDIEVAVQVWRRAHGAFPASNLSDIGADAVYFPGGPPVCPVDGSSYTIDSSGKVVGHTH